MTPNAVDAAILDFGGEGSGVEWFDYHRSALVLASLGGICGATPEYRRIVAAELAAGALAERDRKEGAA